LIAERAEGGIVRTDRRRALTLAASALALAACDDIFKDKKIPLPGDRVAVLVEERAIIGDPKLADLRVALPAPVVNAEWPQGGGYANHAMHHLALADAPAEAWRRRVGRGSDSASFLLASPVVGGGRVYTLDAAARLTAVAAADGRELWSLNVSPKSEADASVAGGIAYDAGRVFVAGGFAQAVAIKADDGQVLWRQPMPAPMRAAPAVLGDRVIVVTVDNHVHALSAADGRVLWSHVGVTETTLLLGSTSPAIEGTTVVAPSSSGDLWGLRVDNGRLLWSDSLLTLRRGDQVGNLADIRARPVIDRGLVFAISNSGRMVAVDLRTGDRAWEIDAGGVETPWVAGDFIYIVTADNQLVCLTRREGRVRWAINLPVYRDAKKKSDRILWAGPLLVGDRLVVAGSRGEAMAISPYTGETLGTLKLPGATYIAPIVADRTLYFLTDDATLVAYR
jgi:outer membrane protein assembly factor BamB